MTNQLVEEPRPWPPRGEELATLCLIVLMLNVGPLLISDTPFWEWKSARIVKVGVLLALIDAMFGLAAYGHFWSRSQYAKRREVTVSLVLREFAQQCTVSTLIAAIIYLAFVIVAGPSGKLFVIAVGNAIVLGDIGLRARRIGKQGEQ